MIGIASSASFAEDVESVREYRVKLELDCNFAFMQLRLDFNKISV